MGRGVWFGAGMAAGVYGMVRVRRIAEAFTVDGMRDRVNAAFVGARMLREEIDQGRIDAEAQLRERLHRASVEFEHAEIARTSPHPELNQKGSDR